MPFTDAELLEWNRRGLIPGPDESEDTYLERVNHCLHLREKLQLDPDFVQATTDEVLKQPLVQSRCFYDSAPDWIPIVFGNKHLAPWHGGCAWIFQMQENGPLGAFIQLRKAFLKAKRYLGLYRRDELMTHELAHVGRMAFEEPVYEEILSYQSSDSWLAKNFGAILESSVESMIFVLTLALILAIDIVTLFYDQPSPAFWMFLLPIGMVCYGTWRLWRKKRRFAKCKFLFHQALQDPQKVQGVIYRLTDKEINAFSQMNLQQMLTYVKDQKERSLRWRVIYNAYLTTIELE